MSKQEKTKKQGKNEKKTKNEKEKQRKQRQRRRGRRDEGGRLSQHLVGSLGEPWLAAGPPGLRLFARSGVHTEVEEPSLGPVFMGLTLLLLAKSHEQAGW